MKPKYENGKWKIRSIQEIHKQNRESCVHNEEEKDGVLQGFTKN